MKQQAEEIERAKKLLAELNSANTDSSEGDAAKYELLQKRDNEMTAFMDNFDEVGRISSHLRGMIV